MRQAQLIEAEHGQGKDAEKQREGHQHPRRLQACLQVQFGAEHAHQGAEHGEAGGHRQHVGAGQAETAQAADLAAQDHAGENRQHRQHARGKRQA